MGFERGGGGSSAAQLNYPPPLPSLKGSPAAASSSSLLPPKPKSGGARQWVVGCPGAVDSQICRWEPLKRTSNQVARPWMVAGAAAVSASGSRMSCSA